MNKTNQKPQSQTADSSMMVTRGKEVGEDQEGKGGQTYSDRRRLEFGW